MGRTATGDRIVLNAPMDLTAGKLAALCGIDRDSPAYEAVEEALPLVNRYGRPRAVIRWANVDGVEGDLTTIEGVTFKSRVVADKLHGLPRVFLSVATAGDELDACEALQGDPFLDVFKGGLVHHAAAHVIDVLKSRFGYDGRATLNPGSLPDWPIRNNFALFEMIGDLGEIGVSLNTAGYISPWNSVSRIHFPGGSYENCSLCKKYDCIRRRAPFDAAEYQRIFGVAP